MYNLQMLLEIGLFIKRKKKKTENKKTKTKKKTKQKPEKNIKIALSLGYPSSSFYDKRYNMLL